MTDSIGTTTYQYDYENRLTKTTKPDGDVVEYKYDPFGRRIGKNVNGVITRFVYDREDILFELNANNNIVTEFVHGPGIDEPIAMIKGGGTYYYHADGLGSIIAITDANRNVVQRYEYDSFGNITYMQDPNFKQPYTYTGREYDEESGLYYYRARYYDAKIGRFLQKDPFRGFLWNPQTLNPYPYVGNSPINFVDPYGFFSVDVGGGATIGFFDFTYGYNSGLGASLTNPQFGVGVFVCIDICDSPAPPSQGCYGPTIDDEPLEEQPITVSVGVGRRSGVSVTSDLCTICINYGWSGGGLPINIGIPIQIQ